MAEEIKVNPNIIQRNSHDVAIELLRIHIQNNTVDYSVENLQDMYARFYATSRILEGVPLKHLKIYLPEKLKRISQQF